MTATAATPFEVLEVNGRAVGKSATAADLVDRAIAAGETVVVVGRVDPRTVDLFDSPGWRLNVALHSAAAVAVGTANVPAGWDEEDELDLVATPGTGDAAIDTNPGIVPLTRPVRR